MSFKEISTWILLFLFAWLGFAYARPLLEAQSLDAGELSSIARFVVGFVVLFSIAHVVIAVVSPKLANEGEDERDRLLELYGERFGGLVLGACIVGGLFIALAAGDRVYANIFFLSLVISEIAKSLWQIVLYRRGA